MVSKALVVGAYHRKVDEMVALGLEMDVVVPPVWGSRPAEITRADAYRIHPLPAWMSGRNHLHLYRGLRRLFDRVRPDLLHVDEEPYSLVTFQAMRLAARAGLPAVFFTWQNIYKRYPPPFSWVERYAFRTAAAAIAGNEEAKAVLRRKGFAGEISVIPQFGVDPASYAPRRPSPLRVSLFGPGRAKVVGFVGRLVEEKGVLTLVDAFAGLDRESRLLLVGGGPMRAAVEARAASAGVASRVRILDDVPSRDVPAYMNCLDCLVLPSLTRRNWKEQFGRVLVEAMACEVPVVGSDSGEIAAVIGDAGVVVPEGDAAALREAMTRLLEAEDVRIRLGARGRARVLERFTQRRVAEETVDVYRRAANRAGRV